MNDEDKNISIGGNVGDGNMIGNTGNIDQSHHTNTGNIGGGVSGGNVNIGGTQSFGDGATFTYSAGGANAESAALAELKALLKELEDALKQAPADKAEDVQLVKECADEIAKEAAQDSPRKKKLEMTGENLKKAAENLLGVAPIVGRIVQKLLLLG